MSVMERLLDGVMRVVRFNDRLDGLLLTVDEQQKQLENLSDRVIRLETALEISLATTPARGGRTRRLPKPGR